MLNLSIFVSVPKMFRLFMPIHPLKSGSIRLLDELRVYDSRGNRYYSQFQMPTANLTKY